MTDKHVADYAAEMREKEAKKEEWLQSQSAEYRAGYAHALRDAAATLKDTTAYAGSARSIIADLNITISVFKTKADNLAPDTQGVAVDPEAAKVVPFPLELKVYRRDQRYIISARKDVPDYWTPVTTLNTKGTSGAVNQAWQTAIFNEASRTLGDMGIVSVFLVLDVYKAEPGDTEVYFCVSDSEANQFADAVLTSLKPTSRAGQELSNAWFAARRAAVSCTCLCENVSYEAREHFITLVTGKTTALPVISWDGVIYH